MKAFRTSATSALRRRFLSSAHHHRTQLPRPFPPSRCVHSRGQVFSSSLAIQDPTNCVDPSVLHIPNAASSDSPYAPRNGEHLLLEPGCHIPDPLHLILLRQINPVHCSDTIILFNQGFCAATVTRHGL